MNLLKQALKQLINDEAIHSILKIGFPTMLIGTWIGYFAGEPQWPLWFYVAWPFIGISAVLLVILCVVILQLRSKK